MAKMDVSLARLVAFRCEIHASFTLRPDALFELIEALPLMPTISSVVGVSLSHVFRRCFSSVYDALSNGKVDRAALDKALSAAEPEDAQTIDGYAVYAVDGTPALRPDAETLPKRSHVYSPAHERGVPGFEYSWLGRVIAESMSWIATRAVDRVPAGGSPSKVAADQVRPLADEATEESPKVVTADSKYANKFFLAAFVGAKHLFALVRLSNKRVLYREAEPRGPGEPGGPRKHGAKVRLSQPPEPDHVCTDTIGRHAVRFCRWTKLHFRDVAALPGVLLRVEFLKPDGSPYYQRPLWLFWTGPEEVAPQSLLRMYRMRYMIEHFFRFLKQHLGLLAPRVTSPEGQDNWVWAVAISFWQLLLARHDVQAVYHPWDPAARRDPARPLTPGQVLAAWGPFLRCLGTPAAPPGCSGKAPGRAPGFKPQPRERFPALKKPKRKKAKPAQEKAPLAA